VSQPVNQAAGGADMAQGAGRRVIVVEDDVGMREAIEVLLDVAGFETTAYASAEDMLSGGAVNGAICVVSDLKLPAMSGLELLGELRLAGVMQPMILITAHDSPAVRKEARRLGAAAILSKPFAGATLLAAIDAASLYASPS
jgi:FixJ family two-component response regulator